MRGRLLVPGLLLAALPLFARADTFGREDIILDPAPDHFSVCYNGSCKEMDYLGLSVLQWKEIEKVFTPRAPTPKIERLHIAQAIGLMERFVGPLTGTEHDLGRNDVGEPGDNWMDCIDESTNATTYLKLFSAAGFMRWHTVQDRATRGWMIAGWPHTTAVVKDITTGELWAVDSWFYRNGQDAVVLPLEEWRDWNPPEKEAKPTAVEQSGPERTDESLMRVGVQ